MDAYVGLYEAARQVMAHLLELGDRVAPCRTTCGRPSPRSPSHDEQELKKLGRYRKLLEEGLQRQLAALEQVRKLSASSTRSDGERAAAKAYRLKLRVVA